jgi:hypothetical protein
MLEMKQVIRGLLAAGLILAAAASSLAADEDFLTYADFIAAVEAGSVKSVSLDRVSSITGTRTVGGQDRPFKCLAETGSANDVLLMRLLNQKGVDIDHSPMKQVELDTGTIVAGLLMIVLPIMTLLIIVRVSMKVSRVRKEVAALSQLLSDDFHDEHSGY